METALSFVVVIIAISAAYGIYVGVEAFKRLVENIEKEEK